jgi:murein DD-endopeptidase MepM/ murein hydrolase activator NlpD
MIHKLSLSSLFLFFSVFTFHAAGQFSVPDTLGKSGIKVLHRADTLLIGPEIYVAEDSSVSNEDETPPFSDVLSGFTIPFEGKVISRYGMRRGRMHTGTDIKLYLGDTVRAVYDGVVSRACRYYGYGNLIVVEHLHGLQTYYAHFSKFLVKQGDHVTSGQPVGLGGRTGRATTEHLHFEIRENGKAYNPELVYDFENRKIWDHVQGKEALAELITNPKTGQKIEITAKGNQYMNEMSTAAVVEYVIKAGDSLWKIARKFNTSVSRLCEHNNLTTQSVLKIGSVVKIQ